MIIFVSERTYHMEDYILREIDRIGEMLMKLARKMGLFLDEVPDYSITDVQKELDRADGSLSVTTAIDTILHDTWFIWMGRGITPSNCTLCNYLTFPSTSVSLEPAFFLRLFPLSFKLMKRIVRRVISIFVVFPVTKIQSFLYLFTKLP